MSAIQVVCAVAVPLLWGYQFVAIKVGVLEFPPLFFLALRFLAIAFLLISFCQMPTSTVRPDRGDFGVSWWTELRAVLRWPWARLWKHVGDRLSTRHALYRAVSLAAARGEAVSHHVCRRVGCIRRCGGAGSGTWPDGKRASAAARGGAAFAFAMSNVLTKRYGPFDPLMLMGWSSLLTVPQVALMSLLLEHGQVASLIAADRRGWLALAYTIFIGGIIGFGLWFWLIARCSMSRVAPLACCFRCSP